MKVKIKKLHPEAVIPKYAKKGDAAMDLTAVSRTRIFTEDKIVYGTGIALEIPEGYVGLIFPRSSVSKTDLFLSNSVGVIDSGYRGEIHIKFKHSREAKRFESLQFYEIGDRIAQLMIIPIPLVEFQEVEELESSERGSGGFGSTGN